MRRFFNSDSPVFRFMTVLMELAEINLLFLLCSLPIVTIGAAYTAMIQNLYDLYDKGEGCFSAKHYWKVFRNSIRKSLPVWCIGLVSAIALLYGIVYWFAALQGGTRILICGIYIVVSILVFGILQFCFFFFALAGKLDLIVLKNSFLLAVAKFPAVILNVLLSASPLIVFAMTGNVLVRVLPLILLYWFACPAYVCVQIMVKAVRPLFPEIFQNQMS